MKLLVGTEDGAASPCVYAVVDDGAIELAPGEDLMGVIAVPLNDLQQRLGGGRRLAVSSITPALPVSNPSKIICLGLNYAAHAREGGFDIPDYPALFLRLASSVTASGQPLISPNASQKYDYEAELMVVIGKGGRHISKERALDHVFGYTTFNDGSIRDYQQKSPQWTAGKNFDQTGAIGPFVVTQDGVPQGAQGLRIQTRINGQVLQDSSTSDMIFGVEETIAILSEIMTLNPGDLIAFGTPQGVGAARKPPVWMKPGDQVEVEIEDIGICQNVVVAETP